MCVIFACYSAVPSEEELTQGAECNTDGAGVAWIDKFNTKEAQVKWIKGLASTAKAVQNVIAENKITFPFMIHYRTASIGGKSAELTHPFPITDSLEPNITGHTRRVLMHNGHIQSWKDWFKPITFAAPDFEIPLGPWSDSRALAAAVNIKGEGVLDFIIEGSRVVVLDAIASSGWKKSEPKSYLRMYGPWIEKEGWYQSVELRPKVTVYQGSGEEWRKRSHCHVSRDARDSKSLPANPTTTVHAQNTWTVDELDGLISVLRKEQNEARILLGV
jgi:hypothetical protein